MMPCTLSYLFCILNICICSIQLYHNPFSYAKHMYILHIFVRCIHGIIMRVAFEYEYQRIAILEGVGVIRLQQEWHPELKQTWFTKCVDFRRIFWLHRAKIIIIYQDVKLKSVFFYTDLISLFNPFIFCNIKEWCSASTVMIYDNVICFSSFLP